MKSTWNLAATVALAAFLGLAGCSGDDGRDGAPGAPGAPGGQGPEGPAGPPGPITQAPPIETCVVCHDSGAVYDAAASHQLVGQVAFDQLAFNNVAGDLVISFNLKVDGVNASDFSFQRQYRRFGPQNLRIDTLNPNPTPITFANLGNGNYTITIANGWAAYAGDNARYLTRLENPAGLRAVVFGDFPDALLGSGLASNESCVNCHGESGEVGRFAQPGAHYSAPMSGDACVVCHAGSVMYGNTTGTFTYGNMMQVGHGIHNSHAMGGYKIRPAVPTAKVYDVTYPTYMTNCSVCHSADTIVQGTTISALDAANAMPVTGEGCFSCHGSM